MRVSPQNNVVEDLDSEKPPRLHQLSGDPEVLFAWAGVAARVVMDQDDPGRGLEQRFPEDIPGMNDACVKSPLRDQHLFDQPICPVQKKNPKDLLSQVSQQRKIVARHIGGFPEGRLGSILPGLNTPHKLKGGGKDRCLGRSDPFHLHQF
jgi:hypothetical protein